MIRTVLFLAQDTLQALGVLLLMPARGFARSARLLLAGGRWCGDLAREWQPRLWERDGDARPETRERRP